MEKLTKGQAIELHRQMWNWIADKTEKLEKFIEEKDYFKATGIAEENQPECDCYCCEYGFQQKVGEDECKCKYCPLDWGSKCNEFMCCYKEKRNDGNGLFIRLLAIDDARERIELIKQIANLKER